MKKVETVALSRNVKFEEFNPAAMAEWQATTTLTTATYAGAGQTRTVVKNWLEKQETFRKSITKPLKDHIKWLESAAREKVAGPTALLEHLTTIMRTYVYEQEVIAAKAVQREAKKLEKKGATQLAGDLREQAKEEARLELAQDSGQKTKKRWTYEIVDESLVPRQYLIVDTSAIYRLCASHPDIPGVRFYQVQDFSR